jgi:hypothetical protein
MADGDPWSMDRIACVYEKDDGSERRFRALEAYQAQAGLGWVACTDPTMAGLERGCKPRRALCWDAGDHSKRRSVVVATNAAYVALEAGTTTLIVQNPSTDVTDTFTVYGLEGERERGKELD